MFHTRVIFDEIYHSRFLFFMSLALETKCSHACGEVVFQTRVIFDEIFNSKFLFRNCLALEIEYSHKCVLMILSQNLYSPHRVI